VAGRCLALGLFLGPVGGPAFAQEVVIAPAPPPPMIREIPAPLPPGRPGDRLVWRHGHWHWDGREWAWQSGYWIERPRAGAEWVPGHWEARGPNWAFIPGHWR
jgi:hypothetical protein